MSIFVWVLAVSVQMGAPGFARGFSALPGLSCPVQEGPTVSIPAGEPITLDGVLDSEEWSSASRYPLVSRHSTASPHSFGGAGEFFLQRQGEEIAVGIRGNQPGFPHLAFSVGDSVWVLHASAALGSIVYERGTDTWALVRGPVWELRDPSLTALASRAREIYLDENGWVGTTAEMGREGDAEFLILPDRFGGENARFAVVFLPVPITGETWGWPEGNSDEIGMLKLLTGPMPEELRLDPTGWGLLQVEDGEEGPVKPPSRFAWSRGPW